MDNLSTNDLRALVERMVDADGEEREAVAAREGIVPHTVDMVRRSPAYQSALAARQQGREKVRQPKPTHLTRRGQARA